MNRHSLECQWDGIGNHSRLVLTVIHSTYREKFSRDLPIIVEVLAVLVFDGLKAFPIIHSWLTLPMIQRVVMSLNVCICTERIMQTKFTTVRVKCKLTVNGNGAVSSQEARAFGLIETPANEVINAPIGGGCIKSAKSMIICTDSRQVGSGGPLAGGSKGTVL